VFGHAGYKTYVKSVCLGMSCHRGTSSWAKWFWQQHR